MTDAVRKRIGRMLISLGLVLSGAGGILVRHLSEVGYPTVHYLQFASETVQQVNFDVGCLLLLVGGLVYVSPERGCVGGRRTGS